MVGEPGSSHTRPVNSLVPSKGFSDSSKSKDLQIDSEGDIDNLLHLVREGGVEFLN
jgi:hypothetical protein